MVRKNISREVKLAVVQDLEAGKSVAQVCREYEVKPDASYRWKHEYERDPVHAFAGRGKASSAEARIAELERTVGRQHMQIDFLKKVHESLRSKLAETKNAR